MWQVLPQLLRPLHPQQGKARQEDIVRKSAASYLPAWRRGEVELPRRRDHLSLGELGKSLWFYCFQAVYQKNTALSRKIIQPARTVEAGKRRPLVWWENEEVLAVASKRRLQLWWGHLLLHNQPCLRPVLEGEWELPDRPGTATADPLHHENRSRHKLKGGEQSLLRCGGRVPDSKLHERYLHTEVQQWGRRVRLELFLSLHADLPPKQMASQVQIHYAQPPAQSQLIDLYQYSIFTISIIVSIKHHFATSSSLGFPGGSSDRCFWPSANARDSRSGRHAFKSREVRKLPHPNPQLDNRCYSLLPN